MNRAEFWGGDAARHFSTEADTFFLAGCCCTDTAAADPVQTAADDVDPEDEDAAAAVLLLEEELEAEAALCWLVDDMELTDWVRNLSYWPRIDSLASSDSRDSVC